jgi:hypothetical protein
MAGNLFQHQLSTAQVAKYRFNLVIVIIILTFCTPGAVEVSIATMSKVNRSKTEEVYVCGFIPCYQLPNKRPNSLDPFLLPLIEEVEELFINGILFYAMHSCNHT